MGNNGTPGSGNRHEKPLRPDSPEAVFARLSVDLTQAEMQSGKVVAVKLKDKEGYKLEFQYLRNREDTTEISSLEDGVEEADVAARTITWTRSILSEPILEEGEEEDEDDKEDQRARLGKSKVTAVSYQAADGSTKYQMQYHRFREGPKNVRGATFLGNVENADVEAKTKEWEERIKGWLADWVDPQD